MITFAKIEDAELNDLVDQLISAAEEYEESAEEDAPDVLYVQKSHENGWIAAIASRHNDNISYMTHWGEGTDVLNLYKAVLAGGRKEVESYAIDVISGWEDSWTDD